MKPELPPPAIGGMADLADEGWTAYTADQMRAFYAEGFRAGMERAAEIAEATGAYTEGLEMAQECAAAIRTELMRLGQADAR